MAVLKTEIEQRISRFEQTCRQTGMKVTHQRLAIFHEVAASEKHPDAETIYQRVGKRVTGISRDTVYRTLATLEAKGLVRRIDVLGGPARYDAHTRQHHHFICTRCGLIKDFHSDALNDLPIPKAVEAFGLVEAAQVQVRGVCSSCANRKTTSRRVTAGRDRNPFKNSLE